MNKVQVARDAVGPFVTDLTLAQVRRERQLELVFTECLRLCENERLDPRFELLAVGLWLWLLDLGTFPTNPEILRTVENYFTRTP